MKHLRILLPVVLALTVLCSCTKKSAQAPSEQRHATVVMRDGTSVPGSIVSSSPTEVTIAGDDKITRTIPMDQVKSIEYGEVAQAQPPAQEQPQASPQASGRRELTPSMPGPVKPSAAVPGRAAEPPARVYEIAAGSQIAIRTNETIDSAKASEGQSFDAQVSKDVQDASGAVVIPRGSRAQLVIVSASKGGRIKGASDLVLDLKSVTIGGQRYQVDAANVEQKGKSGIGANKRTATYTGGGAAVGAIIGAIAGGGKGAAIGAGAGAGAGALTQIVTKGGSIKVPAETVLTFRLQNPLRVTEAK
jgi:hypothetical protein